MAEHFHWTLDYIDSLSLEAFEHYDQYLTIMDALRRANTFLRKIRPPTSEG